MSNISLLDRLKNMRDNSIDVELIPIFHVFNMYIRLTPAFIKKQGSKDNRKSIKGEFIVLQNPVTKGLVYKINLYMKVNNSRTINPSFQTSNHDDICHICTLPHSYDVEVFEPCPNGRRSNAISKYAHVKRRLFSAQVNGSITTLLFLAEEGYVYMRDTNNWGAYTKIPIQEYNKIAKIQKTHYSYLDPEDARKLMI